MRVSYIKLKAEQADEIRSLFDDAFTNITSRRDWFACDGRFSIYISRSNYLKIFDYQKDRRVLFPEMFESLPNSLKKKFAFHLDLFRGVGNE